MEKNSSIENKTQEKKASEIINITLDEIYKAYTKQAPETKITTSKNKKNVIVLALSTVNFNTITGSSYNFSENGKEYSGDYYYQMEPVIKMLSEKLRMNNEGIDKLILLCTKETQQNINNEQDFIDLKPTRESTTTYRLDNCTPLELFVYSIKDWLSSEAEIVSYCLGNESQSTKTIDLDDGITLKQIPIESEDSQLAISSIVEEIRNTKKTNKKEPDIKMDLYVDIHGGPRHTQRNLDAIVYLIENEHIEVKEVYTGMYDKGKFQISKDEGYGIFNLVSGINEFLNSGRYESLEKYAKGKAEKELFNIIKDISEGFQLCNVNLFTNSIEKLSRFQKFDLIENKYIRIFATDIINDYGEILKTQGNERKLHIMKWCLKKGMYQQLLTMIETYTPDILLKNGTLEFGDEHTGRQCNLKERLSVDSNKTYFEEALLCFNVNILSKKIEWKSYRGSYSERKIAYITNRSQSYDYELEHNKYELINIKNRMEDNSNLCYLEFKVDWNDDKLWNKLYQFLKLHYALKALRNDSNHLLGNVGNTKISDVRAATERYFELLDELNLYKIEKKVDKAEDTTINKEQVINSLEISDDAKKIAKILIEAPLKIKPLSSKLLGSGSSANRQKIKDEINKYPDIFSFNPTNGMYNLKIDK